MKTNEFGTIAMAAYRPDPDLFARQLRTIQSQTHRDFECLISADGSPEQVESLVSQYVPGDERFRVIGFESRAGFYGNFERVVAAANDRSQWIALSDQDDDWYPDKLEVLLPHLANRSLVSGQARVVDYPSGRVISATTNRRDLDALHFTLTNQFTGGLCIFRREVLDLALPFPRMSTPSEVHDHWIALCASAQDGTLVIDSVVQDYVQHSDNAIGEMLSTPSPFRLRDSWRNVRSIAQRYEGSRHLSAIARAVFKVSVGWRQLMVDTLADRAPGAPGIDKLVALFGRRRRYGPTMRFIRTAGADGLVASRSILEYKAGWLAGWMVRGRSRKRFG
jgi:glycosyltransferase involved in cell wall biosynthesis